MKPEPVTADHVLKLATSQALRAHLVRNIKTGSLAVLSSAAELHAYFPCQFVARVEDFLELLAPEPGAEIPWWPEMSREEAQIIADRLNEREARYAEKG